MALVYDPKMLFEHINLAFSLCSETELNKKLFDEYFIKNVKDESVDGGKLNEVNSKQCLNVNSSASEDDKDSDTLDRKNKKYQKYNNYKFIHWKDTIDISDNDKLELISSVTCKLNQSNKSQLSRLIIDSITNKSAFNSYSSFGDPENIKMNSIEFSIRILFDNKGADELKKRICIKGSSNVEQLIGYSLYLCQTENYKMNIKTTIDSYILCADEDSVSGQLTSAFSMKLGVNMIEARNLLIKYDPKNYVGKIIFYLKTSSATYESPLYNLNLNTNLKEIVTRYLAGRTLSTDGGFDIYVRSTKAYVKDIDVSLIIFQDQLNENGIIGFDIVYYDNSKKGDGKNKDKECSSFDLYKKVLLIHKFKPGIEVNVAIDATKIEIIPATISKSLFNKVKTIIIPSNQISSCAVKTTKTNARKLLKIYYFNKESQKSCKIEAAYYIIEEMNQKINDIVLDIKNKLKKDFLIIP